MKWFLALLLALNLFVAGVSLLRQHDPVDIHATEVDPGKLKVLPSDWQLPAGASVPVASAPLAASVPLAAVPASAAVAAASTPSSHPPVATSPVKQAAHGAKVGPADKSSKDKTAKVDQPLQCAQWGDLSASLLSRVQGGLPALKLAGNQVSTEPVAGDEPSGPGVHYWVYYPAGGPAGLAAELKSKGFDNYAVQNAGEFKGTLSLGLFGKRTGAQALIDKLRAAGYPKAAMQARGKGAAAGKTRLVFKQLDDGQLAALTTLQKRLTPGIALKVEACGK
jgi:hypothetical protein